MVDRPQQALTPPRRARPSERRAHLRAGLDVEASCETPQGQAFYRALDVSVGGIFLAAADRPPVGSRAKIVLELPGGPALHRLPGRVVRHQAGPVAGFAVAFDPDVPVPTRDAVARYVVESLSPSRPE
jgi:hypothetical protein